MIPVPVVRVILENLEGKVLLLKRDNTGHANNKWCLPGGKVDYGITVEQAAVKEVWEETGLNICNIMFFVYQDSLPKTAGDMHWLTLYLTAEYTGVLALNSESSDAEWAGKEDLPRYDIAFRDDEIIREYFQGRTA